MDEAIEIRLVPAFGIARTDLLCQFAQVAIFQLGQVAVEFRISHYRVRVVLACIVIGDAYRTGRKLLGIAWPETYPLVYSIEARYRYRQEAADTE